MRIRISTISGTEITVFRELVSFTFESRLSGIGSCVFRISSLCAGLTQTAMQKFNKIEAVWTDEQNQSYVVRTGFIAEVKYIFKGEFLEFDGLGIGGFMRYRHIRSDLSFNTSVNNIVSTVHSTIDTISTLPFTLGTVDYSTTKSFSFNQGMSYYDILVKIVSQGGEFRMVGSELQVALGATGITQPGAFKYNSNNPSIANILGGDRTLFTIDDFYNARLSKTGASLVVTEDSTSIAGSTLIERFSNDPDGTNTQTSGDTLAYPNILIDANKEERWNWNVGDRILSYLRVEHIDIEQQFSSVIKNIKIAGAGGRLNVNIEIGEQEVLEGPRNTIDRIFEDLDIRTRTLETNS